MRDLKSRVAGRKSMSRTHAKLVIFAAVIGLLAAAPAAAQSFSFSTGDPDGKIATATRPDSPGKFEIESADDFILTHGTSITSATFTGLLPFGTTAADVSQVIVEMYRVFPKDSDVGRTSGPPDFSTPNVPTRVNSPSDVAFQERDAGTGLSFSMSVLNDDFSALNSVAPDGIHPKPNEFTGGNGPVRGEEVQFTVTLANPFLLPADHYFFVPQVQLDDGDFLWLSAPKPITGGTGPFVGDLQSWTRDDSEDDGIEPDWLRIGTDITHQGPFNAAFSLDGALVPEPSTWAMMLLGFAGLGFAGYRHARKTGPASA
jgi:PEP-CTERM motif